MNMKNRFFSHSVTLLPALILLSAPAAGFSIDSLKTGEKTDCSCAPPSGAPPVRYSLRVVSSMGGNTARIGETIRFQIILRDQKGKDAAGEKISLAVSSGIGKLGKPRILTTGNTPLEWETRLKHPGWLQVKALLLDRTGKPVKEHGRPLHAGAGVMVAPEKIRSACAEPEDFLQFWMHQKSALAAIPLRVEKHPVPPEGKAGEKFHCYDIKVACMNNTPVSGYLTLPAGAKPGSLPAVVSYHGSGVQSAKKIFRANAISLDVNAHGILNGQDREYYDRLNRGPLRDYRHRNKNNRETFYFRDMYLRALRALDYVKSLPEWDGRNLIVVGASQGGAQAIAAAALDSRVSLCLCAVPAMSDHCGELAGRRPGWPGLIVLKDGVPENPDTVRTSRYYDCVNFARYIKAPVFMTTGLVDNTCVPTSVYAVFNNLPPETEKHITLFPEAGHVAKNPAGYTRMNRILASAGMESR